MALQISPALERAGKQRQHDRRIRAVQNATIALAANKATTEETVRVQEILAARFGMTLQTACAFIVGSINEIGGSFAGMNKNWGKAVKVAQAFGAAQALVLTGWRRRYA